MFKRTLLILLCLVAFSWFIAGQEAGATTPTITDFCGPTELADHTCGQFGTNTIRFLEAIEGTCGTVPCTVYYYKYTGALIPCIPIANQIDVAIPLKLNQEVNNAALIHCDKYFTDGTGDPLILNFGNGMLDLGVCRIKFGGIESPPLGLEEANLYIVADPSYIDKVNPLNWAVRIGFKIYKGSVVGPASSVKEVAPAVPTQFTLTSPTGIECTYKVLNGKVTLVPGSCETGRDIPFSKTKLCLPALGEQFSQFTAADGTAYHCETIDYLSDQADIKTTGTDPCKSYKGGLVCY